MNISEEDSIIEHVYYFKSILEQLFNYHRVKFLDYDNVMAILGTLLEPYEKLIVSFNEQNTNIL